MSATGGALVVGGSVTGQYSAIWEEVEKSSLIANTDKMLAEDKKCRDAVSSDESLLRNMVERKADEYRSESQLLTSAPIERIMG